MSTTFEVYPTTPAIPSLADVLRIANAGLHRFLREVDLSCEAALTVRVQMNESHAPIELDLSSPARWGRDQYAWFTIPGIRGGTDAYFESVQDLDREIWAEELESDRYRGWASSIRAHLEIGHYWYFRRSAGQPGLINLSYGLLAGALAQLTHGFVDTTDSWGYRRLPARGEDLLTWYFRPHHAPTLENQEWAQKNIGWMDRELREAGYLR